VNKECCLQSTRFVSNQLVCSRIQLRSLIAKIFLENLILNNQLTHSKARPVRFGSPKNFGFRKITIGLLNRCKSKNFYLDRIGEITKLYRIACLEYDEERSEQEFQPTNLVLLNLQLFIPFYYDHNFVLSTKKATYVEETPEQQFPNSGLF